VLGVAGALIHHDHGAAEPAHRRQLRRGSRLERAVMAL
jgi:hypothetical protein